MEKKKWICPQMSALVVESTYSGTRTGPSEAGEWIS
jgi:hypothetical protein